MSTIKVDTIATRTGSGNITLSNNVASLTSSGAISGTNLSASGTLAVTGTKFMLQQSENLTTEQSLMMNGMFTLMTSLKSNDLKESMSAFIEKRPPKYTGT